MRFGFGPWTCPSTAQLTRRAAQFTTEDGDQITVIAIAALLGDLTQGQSRVGDERLGPSQARTGQEALGRLGAGAGAGMT